MLSHKKSIIQTSLTDSNGRVVFSETPNIKTATLNLENLQTGIYFLKISGENGSAVVKIVKE